MATTVQDFVKNNPTFKATYDANTKTSTITDASGKALTFKSGEANDNGILGGYTNGSNNIDENKLKSYFAPTSTGNAVVNTPSSGIVYDEGTDTNVDTATGKVVAFNVKKGAGAASPYDPTADIAALAAAQRAKTVADLDAKKNASLATLSEQRAAIAPQYQGQRNTQDISSQIKAKNFAEYMASRGENNAAGANGTFDQLKQTSDVANMAALSGLYKGEQGALDNNSRDVAGVNTAYQTDLASANAGANATELANKIQSLKDAQSRQDQLDQFNKTYGLQYGQAVGNIGGVKTLESQQMDTANSQWNKTYDLNKTTTDLNNELTQAEIKERTDPNSTTNKLAKLNLETAQFNYSQLSIEAKQKADKVADDLANGVISREQAQAQINQINAETKNLNNGLTAQGKANTPAESDPKILNQNYNDAIKSFSSYSAEKTAENLADNEADYISQLGKSNYDKLLKTAQDTYYQERIDKWRGNYTGLTQALAANPEYYQKILGIVHYNQLMKLY